MPRFKLDEYGFPVVSYSEFAIRTGVVNLAETVEAVPMPTATPPDGKRWKLNPEKEWVAADDARAHTWFNPANTRERLTPAKPDAVPPAGWQYLPPGVDPAPSPAQALAEAKRAARAQVNLERDRAQEQPLVFEGDTWNADTRAMAAITGKLEELRGTNPNDIPADSLYWISFSNAVKTFTTVAAYSRWLTSLAAAISKRNSEAMRNALTRKSKIDQAQTVPEVWAAANGARLA